MGLSRTRLLSDPMKYPQTLALFFLTMTRLILLAMLLVSIAIADWPLPSYAQNLYVTSQRPPVPDIVAQLNHRLKQLYNARMFNALTKELYAFDAIVKVTKYNRRAEGHEDIEQLLVNTAYGIIQNIEIVDVRRGRFGSYEVDAIMRYLVMGGSNAEFRLKETIQFGRFSRFTQLPLN